jgi:hypothetical protein
MIKIPQHQQIIIRTHISLTKIHNTVSTKHWWGNSNSHLLLVASEMVLASYKPNIFWGGAGTGVWTNGLHLEPLHQSFFLMGFSRYGFKNYIAWVWLQTVILLISDSWEARITGVSHPRPAPNTFLPFQLTTVILSIHSKELKTYPLKNLQWIFTASFIRNSQSLGSTKMPFTSRQQSTFSAEV